MPSGVHTPFAIKAKALELLRANPDMNYIEIGKLAGCSSGVVSSLAHKHGLNRKWKGVVEHMRKLHADPACRAKQLAQFTPERREQIRLRRLKYPPEVLAKVVDLLKTQPKLTYEKVAELCEVDENFVANAATRNGLAKYRQTPKEKVEEIVLALREQEANRTIQGSVIDAIAEMCGSTPNRVQAIQQRYGIIFKKTYRPFEEAKEWARSMSIPSSKKYEKVVLPSDVPRSPETVYKDEWKGWADYLDVAPLWTKEVVQTYLRDIQAFLPELSDADVVKILRQAGLLPRLGNMRNTNTVAGILQTLRAGELPELDHSDNGLDDEDDTIQESDYESPEPEIHPHLADRMKGLHISADTLHHIMESQLAALRAKWFREGDAVPVLALFGHEVGGEFFQEIRRRFLEEVTAVESLATPWWGLRKNGKPVPPSPMQKYVAWRLKKDRVFGNWSGTGAGKTDSAGLAAYVIGSELTAVLAANSTVLGWKEQLQETFPGCRVFTKIADVQRGPGAFLILNYERFQTGNAHVMVEKVIALRPDFVVLDEVQMIKQRGGEASNRSFVIRNMLSYLPKTRVLGMSATPVINELREGISLLEAIKQTKLSLKTRSTVSNALDLFEVLRQTGVRYIPKYEQTEETVKINTQRDDLFSALRMADDILPIEQILLPAKLELVKDRIKPGTILYLEYVEGMVGTARAFVESLGFTVGEYVGDTDSLEREEIKRQFIAGEIDVLIGSRAISVGVDGLQERCVQLVLLSLPWTHAAYTQIVGRVYRQGGIGIVQVVIPHVVIDNHGKPWSWDEIRMKRIEDKRTLAECAVDGVVPTSAFSEQDSRRTLAIKAVQALNRLSKKAKASAV